MGDTYRALLIKDGVISPVDLRKAGYGAQHTRELIGDTFCSAFVVWQDHDRKLVGYCDDNGLLKNLPVNVLLSGDLYQEPGYPIVGPIVVTAHEGPDTTDMTDNERSGFYTVDMATVVTGKAERRETTPVLHYRGPRARSR